VEAWTFTDLIGAARRQLGWQLSASGQQTQAL